MSLSLLITGGDVVYTGVRVSWMSCKVCKIQKELELLVYKCIQCCLNEHAGRKTKRRVTDVTDAGSNVQMVNRSIQTVAASSSSRSLAATITQQQQQTSVEKTQAHTSSSRQATDKTMSHLYGLYQCISCSHGAALLDNNETTTKSSSQDGGMAGNFG